MFEFLIENHDYKHVHFIGIGGISMSGLAEILLIEGYKVSGTDNTDSSIVNRLRKLGAKIFIGHNKDNILDADLIIYTDAISKDNEELIAAINSGAPVVDRASFLGALMKNYKNSIAISGTHGKTTTTSMVATIMNHGKLNPTILIGGELDDIGGNVKIGTEEYILTEACEYRANILKYFPTMAIILNMDEDHLDYFKSMDHIVDTFIGYVKNLDDKSNLIINADDPYADKVKNESKANIISFGLEKACDYRAENIRYDSEGFPSYSLNIRNSEIHEIKLSVMGIHNIYNSLAAIATTHTLGLPMDVISEFITYYNGVHRRLEFKGYINNTTRVVDDYAHHPTEIRATLSALKKSTKGKIYCVFQPHTFTRTKILLDSFAKSFEGANKIIIADIYAARELDNGEIHSKELANRIKENGEDSIYISSFEEIEKYLVENAKDNDIIVTMGAGNVYKIGDSILSNHKENKAV